jgi:hypothetical protein
MGTRCFEEHLGCAMPDIPCNADLCTTERTQRVSPLWSENSIGMPVVAAMSSEQDVLQTTENVPGIHILTMHLTLRHRACYVPQHWIYPATLRALFN